MLINYKEIGLRLKQARIKAGLTQAALASALGLSVSYIKTCEFGRKPSLEYIVGVSEICSVSIDWIMTGAEIIIDDTISKLPLDQQRILKTVIDLLNNENPDIRSWAKIQIKRAFPEYFKEENK